MVAKFHTGNLESGSEEGNWEGPSYSCASFTRGPGHLSRSNHQGSLKKTQCAKLVFTSSFIVEIKALRYINLKSGV